MAYKIEIQPADVHFNSDNIILTDALEQSVPLEYSCKTGECGSCSAEVLAGEVKNESGEIVHSGSILTCQSKALSDVTLKANYYPELAYQKIQTLPCKVVNSQFVTDDILVLKLRFPPTASFDYLPGQYVNLNFKGIKRSYSIANAKRIAGEIELHIRKLPNGQMSEALFSGIKENQLMRVEGPKGTFFIRDNDKPLILLAGGTGIAPVKAMVEKLIENKDKRDIYIYWGMNNENSFYLNVFEELAKEFSNIHYTPVLSSDVEWCGRMGFVHQAVCDDFDSLHGYEVYACGSPVMINIAKKSFMNKKLPKEQFLSDAFTPAK